jgi:hypothetical protein
VSLSEALSENAFVNILAIKFTDAVLIEHGNANIADALTGPPYCRNHGLLLSSVRKDFETLWRGCQKIRYIPYSDEKCVGLKRQFGLYPKWTHTWWATKCFKHPGHAVTSETSQVTQTSRHSRLAIPPAFSRTADKVEIRS